ncbi:DUF6199 family natural product biosynthesis protein [Paenibacillus sp. 598K]|uniref:DUF6199 family natural product biosynthesis protein n=1 Tax=Paenibacillus sp. 598K TaxID=1117987 RepID=UPI0026A2CC10
MWNMLTLEVIYVFLMDVGPGIGITIVITVFLIIWTILALAAAIHPRLFWNVTQGWKKATKEPPKLYFTCLRVLGIILSLIGLYLLFSPMIYSTGQ